MSDQDTSGQTHHVIDDDLDGTGRVQMVAAQIAKHKELLAPDAPVVAVLRDVRAVLDDMLIELQKIRNVVDQSKNKS